MIPALPPLILRGIVFDPPLFCAPMAGITHSAFRRLLAGYGGYGALFTEMLSAKWILNENIHTSPALKRRSEEGKVIYQLLATEPEPLPRVLDRLAPLKPDGLDLNAACSAFNVRRQGGGSDIFADAGRFRDIVRTLRRHFSGPLTVKIRPGRQTPDWRGTLRERLRLLEDEGVDALTLHTRFEGESVNRPARHALHAELAAETRLPVIANGDISGADAYRARAAHLASSAGIMIGRMAAACPWVFAQWGNPQITPDPVEMWARLCAYICEDFPPEKALIRIKIITPYVARNFVFGHTLFSAVQSSPDLATALARAEQFMAAAPPTFRTVSLDGI